MVQTIPAKDITLRQLRLNFNLERTYEPEFFPEWQGDLPELTDFEKQLLDELKQEYLYLSESPLLEPIIKMVVLSPLLKIAGFYRPPFEITAEKEVRISSEDEGTIITGRLDILIFQPEFWVTVIESKRAEYSLKKAIPQALAYMLGHPNADKKVFGFVTNGDDFQFLKLTKQNSPKYARSSSFSIDNIDDLYTVAKTLKHIAQLIK